MKPDTDDDADIDDWLAELAGTRPAGSVQTDALRRSLAERVARAAEADGADAAARADDERAWQQLRFRLRREGPVAAPAPHKRVWWPSAAAAAVLAALVLPAVFTPQQGFQVTAGDPPTMRGADDAALAVADPLARAQRLARQLQALGARPVLYFQDGTATVDFQLAGAQVAAAEQAVQQETPGTRLRGGFNRIVFKRP